MATKGTREQEARKDGEAWPVGRGARGSGATAVWGHCQQHRVLQKVKGTWTAATVEMGHFYIQMSST